jgi:catechol 2,3-dioxygenase-like lactoylglutathione lyase family enzyme
MNGAQPRRRRSAVARPRSICRAWSPVPDWVPPSRGACLMPIPPRVSVVALRTADLARSTAFYVGLGGELSPASTAAMSLFKTAGSLLLVCTDDLLVDLGGHQVAAALAGEPTGEAVLSIHVASDAEVDAALQEATGGGGVVVKGGRAHPAGRVVWVLCRPRWAGLGGDPPPALSAGQRWATRGPLGLTGEAARSRSGWRRPPCTERGRGPRLAGRPPARPDRPA